MIEKFWINMLLLLGRVKERGWVWRGESGEEERGDERGHNNGFLDVWQRILDSGG